ncbi:MAG TPA: terminase small subunit [Mucilaginibacter sp.]|nr:terminase small subunit [Mucilaginibacter sp.]
MKKRFNSAKQLDSLIQQYFESSEEENQTGSEPPTLAGLALFLGFESRQDIEVYENKPRYAALLKRARLRVEAAYEKKLHTHSSGGAVFALKSMGWNERTDDKTPATGNPLQVEIIHSGPKLASSEKEVEL